VRDPVADVSIHGVPVPEWLQNVRPGDPVEITIRGSLESVFTDFANGPPHLVMDIRYGEERLHPGPLYVTVPAEPGVTVKTFTLTPVIV